MTAEDKLIQRIARVVPARIGRGGEDVRLGIGDDAAILKARGRFEWVVSCDNFIEGVHFRRGMHPPDSVGYKALVRAASDLVAMGARPAVFLLALAFPADHTGSWLDEFLGGMGRAARQLAMHLIGGDVTPSKTISASLTVFGYVKVGKALTRCGARPGDRIYVSGTLGKAQLGLELLGASKTSIGGKLAKLLEPHLYPRIRVGLGLWLAEHRVASAMMDLSDGLSTDLNRLCEASGVGAKLWADKIPRVEAPDPMMKKAPRNRLDPLELALHGGDDYELLFTVPARNEARLRKGVASSRKAGFAVTCVGEIVGLTPRQRHGRAARVLLVGADGVLKPIHPGGWDPFRR